MSSTGETKKANLPPYTSYKTFTGFLQKLKETTVPGRIDSSVLRSYAGSVARQLIVALKYLKLIEPNGDTSPRLKKLIATYATADWSGEVSGLVIDTYLPIIAGLDLHAGTYKQLVEAFRTTGADGVVLDRAVNFFLAAAKDAEMDLSPHFTNRPRRPRSDSARATRKKKLGRVDEESSAGDQGEDELTGSEQMARFKFAIPGKPSATVIVPVDISGDDWDMVHTMMQAYVLRLEKQQATLNFS